MENYTAHTYLTIAVIMGVYRSKERLEQWRADAREAHLRPAVKEQPDLPLEVTDTTPFATERQQSSKPHLQNEEKPAKACTHLQAQSSVKKCRK